MSDTDPAPESDPVGPAVPVNGNADAADHAGLRRRLADAAATTTFDEEQAWEEIQARISSVPASGVRRLPLVGSAPKRVLVAAVVVLVLGVLLWLGQEDDGGGRVVTQDSTTTTDGDGTTSTTDERDATTTSTTLRLGDAPENATGTGTTTAGGSPAVGSEGSDGGIGGDDGGGEGGSTTTSSAGTGPSTSPPANTAGDGRRPAVTLSASAYTAWATAWSEGGSYSMSVWAPQLDTYVGGWSWASDPGRNCLEVSSGPFSGPGGSHTLVWGLVRSDAASVRIVTTGNVSASAVLGPEVESGLRPWIGEAPRGQIDRAEAIDGSGTVLHTSTAPGWATAPATC